MSICIDFSYALGELWLHSVTRGKGTSYLEQKQTGIAKNVCFTLALWALCLVVWLITKAHNPNCIPAFRMQLTKLQKADLVSFADGLWVSCGIILNYIGSQSLVLKRCSEPRVVMCLDHSVGKQALKLKQLLWKAAAEGPARSFQHLKDCSSPWDALWGWPSDPMMGCGAFCPKGIARTRWAGKDFLEQILGFVFSAWAPLVDVGIAALSWLVIHKMRQVSPIKSASPLHNVWKNLLQQAGELLRGTIASTCTKRSVCLYSGYCYLQICYNLRNISVTEEDTDALPSVSVWPHVLCVILRCLKKSAQRSLSTYLNKLKS